MEPCTASPTLPPRSTACATHRESRSIEPGLTVRYRGTTVTVDRFPVSIGRDDTNDVVIDATGVSRRHLLIERDGAGAGFVAVDTGSTNGVVVEGIRAERHAFTAATELRLGRAPTAPLLTVAPAGSAATSMSMLTPADSVLDAPTILPKTPLASRRDAPRSTAVPSPVANVAQPAATNGHHSTAGSAEATMMPQATPGAATPAASVTVHVGGRTHDVRPGRERVIGRDGSCDIVVDHPLVSRRHAVVRHDGTHWTLTDLESSHGTYVDGRRVTSVRLSGVMALWLGGVEVGERATVRAGGERRSSLRARLTSGRSLPVVLVLAVLALLAGGAALIAGPIRSNGAAPVSELQQAAVKIETSNGSGSGTLISADGLVLTNAHVVAPDAVGQGVLHNEFHRTPPRPLTDLTVFVTRRPGETAGFRASVVAADGYLDLALVRLVATIDGAPLPDRSTLHLPHVAIAPAAAVRQGTRLRVLGFPAIAGPATVTITEGTVSSFASDARLGGEVGFFVTDAVVGHGNSGGLAADERNRLVGVPTARRTADGDQVAVVRPASLARAMITAEHDGKPYVSPYVKDKGDEKISAVQAVAPGTASGIDLACVSAAVRPTAGMTALGLSFVFDGFTEGRQDLAVTVRPTGTAEPVGTVAIGDHHPTVWRAKGCATVTVAPTTALAAGDYQVEFWVGGNLVLANQFTLHVDGAPSAATPSASASASAPASAPAPAPIPTPIPAGTVPAGPATATTGGPITPAPALTLPETLGSAAVTP